MSRPFPPKQINVCTDKPPMVVIGYLEPSVQKTFWQKVKAGYPDILKMRRDMAFLIKDFNAVMQIPLSRYNEIMGEN